MISINNLSFLIGDRALFKDASLFISPRDRIGLIGLNGTGKSTLLRMLIGEVTPTSGEISKGKGTTIGFLNQDLLSYQSDETILEVAMQAFKEAGGLQDQINIVLQNMEKDYKDELVGKLAKLQERYEAMDGYVLQSRAEEILEGIGFKTKDLKRPLREFSGGWRMRVMLAKLLLEKPALLLLDEPTNHLDLPSIQWLEDYLQNYDGAFIIVSHDRRFLNTTVKKIVEVYARELSTYSGNYDFYEKEKELRNEIQQNAFENQQQKIKEAERFIERFRAKATKAKQAQSKIKQLQKIDRIEAVVDENSQVNFRFNFKTKSGRHIVRLENITKTYGDLKILDSTDAHIERGDKIALIGANGKGKSTALRVIAKTEEFDGRAETGHNVITSFFAQHQLEALDIENEIIDELKQQGTGKTEQELRSVLGCFLFNDEEVYKKIKILSGGEKSRVALAKTLISESNFLLLDEPTNHLDILSVNRLVQALQQFEGTFLVVSHDRDFISKIANKIWWIEDKKLKEYPGNYQEYEWWVEQHTVASPKQEMHTSVRTSKKYKKPKQKKRSPKIQLEKEIHELELKIEGIENQCIELELQMEESNIHLDVPRLKELNQTHKSLKSEIEKLTMTWEAKSTEFESHA